MKCKIFEVVADYRPINDNRPRYKRYGKTKSEVIQEFQNRYTWLKVYDCYEIDEYGNKK